MKKQRIVKGILTDDGTSCLQYGYDVYVNEDRVLKVRYKSSIRSTKWQLRRDVRSIYKHGVPNKYEFQLPPKDIK